MGEDNGVVVDVDDAAAGPDLLGDFVGAAGGGYAGTDVEELRQPGLVGQEPDRASEEGPILACRGGRRGVDRRQRVCVGPVGGEVILAAQPVVVDPGMVRDAGVECRVAIVRGRRGIVAAHVGDSFLYASSKM